MISIFKTTRHYFFLAMISFLALVTLSGCGKKIAQEITIRPLGNEMKFDITEIRAKAGTYIRVIMENTANTPVMKHNVLFLINESYIDEIGKMAYDATNHIPIHNAIIASTPMAEPQTRQEVVFKVPEPGSYPYICTYPGHYVSMRGTLISEK